MHAADPARFDEAFAHWMSDGAYLLGSLLFVAGSLCGLWMWKAEHFGFGFISEINVPLHAAGTSWRQTSQPSNSIHSATDPAAACMDHPCLYLFTSREPSNGSTWLIIACLAHWTLPRRSQTLFAH